MKHVSQSHVWFFVKWTVVLSSIIFIASCSAIKPIPEDTMIITRKYVGTYLDYRRTLGEGVLDPDIFWIKTSLEEEFGKIGVYAKGEMSLSLNDRLYLRRTHYHHPAMSSWVYHLESGDQQVFYVVFGTNKDSTRISALSRLFDISKQDK